MDSPKRTAEWQATVARVDFLWPARWTVGEADGRQKYGLPETLWAEKRHEDLLRELGYEVVRWTWDDVKNHPAETAERIRAAFRRAAERRRDTT